MEKFYASHFWIYDSYVIFLRRKKNLTIKDKLISEYPLRNKIDCPFECFEAVKRRYIIFYNEKINRDNIESLLDVFNSATKNISSKLKTLIVVGYTDDFFQAKDLLFFNGADTFIVYYLKNNNSNEIYFNNQRVFWFSIDWKKIIDRFNNILQQ